MPDQSRERANPDSGAFAEAGFFDAHNHLASEILAPVLPEILETLRKAGVAGAAVNGTCVEDWERVAELAAREPWVVPQFGYHPWKVRQRPADWRERLEERLLRHPQAGVGEAGLDAWVRGHDLADQAEVLRFELDLAARLDRPVTLHCLKAWEELERIVRKSSLPEGRFLIHACAAPRSVARGLLDRGAVFSFPGSFLAPNREAVREFFRLLPPERILAETDAPSLPLPRELERWRLPASIPAAAGEKAGAQANHPANIVVVYEKLAALRGAEVSELKAQCADNFRRLFLWSPRSGQTHSTIQMQLRETECGPYGGLRGS